MRQPPHLLPALITPFDADGEVDIAAHRHNLTTLSGKGIEGFLVAGSTGEGPYLERGERRDLIKAARQELPDAYLTCGVAAETIRQAKAMINEAVQGGADSILVITPTTLTRNRVIYVNGYYLELAESSPLPLLLYSVPAVTAFELPDDSVSELSSHPNIVGIKDSGGDPVRMQRLVPAVAPEFLLFTGSTHAVSMALGVGAYGAITASTNYLAVQLLELVDAAQGDMSEARQLQQEVSRIARGVEAHGIPGVKSAAELAGLKSGDLRRPLLRLDDGAQARVASLLRSLPTSG